MSDILSSPIESSRQCSNYTQWKAWDRSQFGVISDLDRRYFDAELQRVGGTGIGLRVLEIGFGNGKFLAYARHRGWNVTGTEIDAGLVETARERGFDVECREQLTDLPSGTYDLVVAFDVLEHIPQEQLVELFFEIKRVAKAGGTFLSRFPNGDSPFSMVNQNGDVTHVTVIGSGKLTYLAMVVGATVVFVGGQAMPLRLGNLKRSVKRMASQFLRGAVEFVVRQLFFAGERITFCSPNLVAVLRFNNSAT